MGFLGQHRPQDLLQGQGMGAHAPTAEEIAGTKPLIVFETRGVTVIIAAEGSGEVMEGDALRLLRVELGLFNLPD